MDYKKATLNNGVKKKKKVPVLLCLYSPLVGIQQRHLKVGVSTLYRGRYCFLKADTALHQGIRLREQWVEFYLQVRPPGPSAALLPYVDHPWWTIWQIEALGVEPRQPDSGGPCLDRTLPLSSLILSRAPWTATFTSMQRPSGLFVLSSPITLLLPRPHVHSHPQGMRRQHCPQNLYDISCGCTCW